MKSGLRPKGQQSETRGQRNGGPHQRGARHMLQPPHAGNARPKPQQQSATAISRTRQQHQRQTGAKGGQRGHAAMAAPGGMSHGAKNEVGTNNRTYDAVQVLSIRTEER